MTVLGSAIDIWGYLFREKPVLEGRWHFRKDRWEFEVTEVLDGTLEILAGQTLEVLDGYWGERAQIALDEALEWHEEHYDDVDDHTHCSICWATTATTENSRFMVSSVLDTLCMDCYVGYVLPRNLGFIPTNE